MHSLTLVTVEIPEVIEDQETNAVIEEKLAEIERSMEEDKDNGMLDIFWNEYNNLRTSFSRVVRKAVCEVMERYNVETENPDYLEFLDKTEELQMEYAGSTPCLKLPQGAIVPVRDHPYYERFVIHDGKVFERNAGSVKQDRRTKKAKRIKALPYYPWKKLYPSFEQYVEDRGYCEFYEEENGYGYYYNPDGMWDWYSIGGRWPFMLLVKDTCTEYSVGEKSWACGKEPDAPEGYIWVSGARKKDIEWQVLLDWRIQKAAEHFSKLERFFLTGKRDEVIRGSLVEDGIIYCGDYLYHQGETLEGYLTRCGYDADCRYAIFAHDLIGYEGWQSGDDFVWDKKSESEKEAWRLTLTAFLDGMQDEDVLVVVDCHM